MGAVLRGAFMSETNEQATIHLTGLRRMGVWLRLLWRNNISGPSEDRRFRRRYMAVWIEENRDPNTFPRPSKVSVTDIERSMERARERVAASRHRHRGRISDQLEEGSGVDTDRDAETRRPMLAILAGLALIGWVVAITQISSKSTLRASMSAQVGQLMAARDHLVADLDQQQKAAGTLAGLRKSTVEITAVADKAAQDHKAALIQLVETNTALGAARSSLVETETQLDGVAEQLARQRAASADMESSLAQSREAAGRLRTATVVQRSELADINNRIDAAHAQETEAAQSLAQLAQQAAMHVAIVGEAEAALQRTRQAADQAQAQFADTSAQLDRSAIQRTEAEQQLNLLQRQLTVVQAAVEAEQQRLVEKAAQLEQVGQQVMAAEQRLAVLQREAENAQSASAAAGSQVTDTQAQFAQLAERHSAAEQRLNSLQVQADNARQDGAVIEQQLADSKAQLTRLMEQRSAAEQQVSTLATQVERSTKEASDAESRLANARSQLEQAAAEQRLLSAGTAQGPVSAEGVPAPNPARAVAPVETQTTLSPRRGVGTRPVVPPAASSSAMLAKTMVRRGDALLQRGDVSAARLLYERAAAAGSGRAATAMGKTFDPTFLAGIGVSGTGADPALATRWYRRAAGLGDEEARTRLQAPPSTARRTSTTSERRP